MKLQIHSGKKIGEINSEFQKAFPFLKLCFFRSDRFIEGTSHPAIRPESSTVIGKQDERELIFSYSGKTKVKKLEEKFRKEGLSMQVFRKSGRSWLVTTTSDEKTLGELNGIGEELSVIIPEEAETEADVY